MGTSRKSKKAKTEQLSMRRIAELALTGILVEGSMIAAKKAVKAKVPGRKPQPQTFYRAATEGRRCRHPAFGAYIREAQPLLEALDMVRGCP